MPLPKIYGAKVKINWDRISKPKQSTYIFEKDRKDADRKRRDDGLTSNGRDNQGTERLPIRPEGKASTGNADKDPADGEQQPDAVPPADHKNSEDPIGDAKLEKAMDEYAKITAKTGYKRKRENMTHPKDMTPVERKEWLDNLGEGAKPIQQRFYSQPLTPEELSILENFRKSFAQLAIEIDQLFGGDQVNMRCQTIAQEHLEIAAMYVTKMFSHKDVK